MNICSIIERRRLEAAVPGCQIEWIVDESDGGDVEELVNVVELVEGPDGEECGEAWPPSSPQQAKRKRAGSEGDSDEERCRSCSSSGGDHINNTILNNSSSNNNAKQGRDQYQKELKRARLEDIEKPQLFDMWLKMKRDRRHDRKLQDLVDAFVLPEDIYQHFQEFVPRGATPADTDAIYMRKLQYERECAERALNKCKARSWLLRRSSLNRRPVVLRVPCELGLGDRLRFGPHDAQRPTFYAFSYSAASGQGIAHVLIMKWKNLWARCDCDDGVETTPTFYSTSFIAVLDRLLESEDLRPDRMVHGYLASTSSFISTTRC